MLRTCRLLLAKGAFHSIRESEIFFVLRIIKRNYKLQFSGLTVKKVIIPIIEYTSCICGDEVLHTGRPFAPQTHMVSYCGRISSPDSLVTMVTRSKELTFLVVVVPRGPGNQDPRERIRTSLQPGDLMDSWKGGRGLPPLRAWGSGPQREDQDLSLARVFCCCCVIMFLLGESSCSQPPYPCHPVRFQLATRALHPLPPFLPQICCCCSILIFSWVWNINETAIYILKCWTHL